LEQIEAPPTKQNASPDAAAQTGGPAVDMGHNAIGVDVLPIYNSLGTTVGYME
jgi:hypothetical protein